MDFSRLLSFRGRIRRSEWWLAHLFALTVLVVTVIAVSTTAGRSGDGEWVALPIVSVTFFACFIAWTSAIKRLHDLDMSGWMVLPALLPVIGWIYAVVMFGCMPGTPGPNRFGLPSEELDRNPLAGIYND